ncbi:MAG: sensor histidine kinase [Parahaliea sp.]
MAQIMLATVAYLGVLFLVAILAERNLLPRRLITHPLVYVLSMGVFAGGMASNAIFELVYRYGYGFLIYYLGAALIFLVAALLLLPLLRLCRTYQLTSLADVLAFRFRSQWVGSIVSIAMCIAVIPLIALQIQAVSDSFYILAHNSMQPVSASKRPDWLALLFCLTIIGFASLFGTRNIATTRRNTGLVVAIAFESLMKLTALLTLMFAAIYQIFGGFGEMQQWVSESTQAMVTMQRSVDGNLSRLLLLIFFAGTVCMPHVFHMVCAENRESFDLRMASWGVPLFLLLISLPVLPITWAALSVRQALPAEYSSFALGLALQSPTLSATAFIASVSAASATIIVTTLALANMALNHLVLPGWLNRIDQNQSLYTHLKDKRRVLIAVLILIAYGYFIAINGYQNLADLGLMAFVGTLQFLPGVIATPYWPGANQRGLLAGLATGLIIWAYGLLLPSLNGEPRLLLNALALDWFGTAQDIWAVVAILSLSFNTVLFVLVSLATGHSEEERVAAELCSTEELYRPIRRTLVLRSVREFTNSLASALGERTAHTEVQRALQEQQLEESERRPFALRRLRDHIEANLSGLLGPSVASSIVNTCIPYRSNRKGNNQDFFLIEHQLDKAQSQFTGLTAELNTLRRHYRQTLDNLPIGIFSVAADGEILLWNQSMVVITRIPAHRVIGSLMDSIPPPWRQIFSHFLCDDSESMLKREVALADKESCWISLHKTNTDDEGNRLVLVEDISEVERLEQELLHKERLASIGRLAAGIAHEIGNPITGIACLAQNLEYAANSDDINETGRDILKQTERISRIVESLINFSHAGSRYNDTRLTTCNLADCVDEAIHLLQLDLQAQPVDFNNSCDRETVVIADSQKLLQVLINLLANARDACPDRGGHISISSRLDSNNVCIDIEDNGHGIANDIQSQIFEPFFSTKEAGEGTGLGLALVHSIMEDMGGSISLLSPLDQSDNPGTRISLKLRQGSYEL